MSDTIKVVIDPGHGANLRPTYPDGTCETNVVWNTANTLRELLQEQGHTAMLTKDTRDAAPRCRARGKMAVDENADIFVSLHCNAVENSPQARGVFGIFYGKNARENRAPDAEIRAPGGRRLARLISQEIHELTGMPLRGVDGAKLWWRCPQNLDVLTGGGNWAKTDAACLIEAGYLSNDEDRALMGSEQGQRLYALGCARGIYRYAGLEIPKDWGRAEAEETPDQELEPGEEPLGDEAAVLNAAADWARSVGLIESEDMDRQVSLGQVLTLLHKIHGG